MNRYVFHIMCLFYMFDVRCNMSVMSNWVCSREPREILPVPDPQCRSGTVAVPGLSDRAAAGSATSGTS